MPQFVVPRGRPEEEAGGNADRPRDQKTEEARPDRRGGLGNGDREHEHKERSRRGRRGQRCDDAGVQNGEPDHGHGHHGRQFVGRGRRAQDDETAAHGEERKVSGEPGPRPPGEFHQEQEGERAERGEQIHLAVRESGVGESEGGRHDQGGAHRTLEGQQLRVLGPVPTNGCHPRARCGAGVRGGHLRHRAGVHPFWPGRHRRARVGSVTFSIRSTGPGVPRRRAISPATSSRRGPSPSPAGNGRTSSRR